MAVPKFDELMKPLLELLGDGKEYDLKEANRLLAKKLELSKEDLAQTLNSGGQIFRNRVGWAKTYLKEAGLIKSPGRGTLIITEAGKKVLAASPEKIDTRYLKKFPTFQNFISKPSQKEARKKQTLSSQTDNLTPHDQLEEAYKQINSNLASELLNEVLSVKPYTFEKMVIDLLSKMGYGAVAYGNHVTAASWDDGIDGVIMKDKLGFSLIYIQAKQWAADKTVGQAEIQKFVGAIALKHGEGLFVTTAKFSQKAKEYADIHHIILIDGKALANLMIEYNFCVSVRKTFEIKTIDTDALADYQED